MSRTSRVVLAAAVSGCLLTGVVVGALAWSGGGDAAGPVSTRAATPVATTTTTAVAIPSSSTVASTATTALPPSTAPATTAPPTTAAPGPVADFAWSPEQPRPGESIRLLDRSSGSPVSYTWRWSGSTIRSSKAGNIAFSLQQDTDVTLEVCDRGGRCSEATKTIVVG